MKFRKTIFNFCRGAISCFARQYLILAILLIAAFLRLYKISDYMTFLGDEGRDALVVYNILHGKLTLLGPTASVGGFFMGPIYYYFMTPFLWLFNYNPAGPAVMVALFGIATVWLVYKVGKEFFGTKAGVISALIYAVSPVVIAYSRSSWNPNLMPFFSLLTVYMLYKAVLKNNFKFFILTGILYGIAIQLHYIELFLGAAIVFYILFIRVFVRSHLAKGATLMQVLFRIIKDYFFISVGFIIGFSPFLAFELRHGFPNTRSIINFIFSSKDTGVNEKFLDVLGNVFFRLFGRLITRFLPLEQIDISKNLDISIWYYLTLLLAFVSVLIFAIKFLKDIKEKKNVQKYIILIVWFVIVLFLYGFYKKAIYDYYLELLFPLPFLFVGLFLSTLLEKGIILKIVSISIITALFIWNIDGMPFKFPPNKQMEQVRNISEFVLSKTDNKPFNFALVTAGNSDHGYRYFMKLAKKDPIIIENFDNDPKRLTVKDQLLVICEDPNCKPLGHSLWEIAGFGRAEIDGKWDINFVRVYKLVHYKGK